MQLFTRLLLSSVVVVAICSHTFISSALSQQISSPTQSQSIFLDPMEQIRAYLQGKGWTLFYVPSSRFIAGTIISPAGQSVKLDQKSCFPNLRVLPAQPAILPDFERGQDFEARGGFELLRIFLGIQVNYSNASTAHIRWKNVKHVAVDLMDLEKQYNSKCNRFIKSLATIRPIVISELLSAQIEVTFKHANGTKAEINVAKIEGLASDLTGNAQYDVTDGSTVASQENIAFAFKGTSIDQEFKFSSVTPEDSAPDYLAVWMDNIERSGTVAELRDPIIEQILRGHYPEGRI